MFILILANAKLHAQGAFQHTCWVNSIQSNRATPVHKDLNGKPDLLLFMGQVYTGYGDISVTNVDLNLERWQMVNEGGINMVQGQTLSILLVPKTYSQAFVDYPGISPSAGPVPFPLMSTDKSPSKGLTRESP